MHKSLFNQLLRLWLIHLCIILSIATVLYSFSVVSCYSALLGGLIFLIPNIYFAAYAFRYDIGHDSCTAGNVVVRNFYRGEAGKFILSSVGFALAFTLVSPINGYALFLTYIGLTLVQWVAVGKLRVKILERH